MCVLSRRLSECLSGRKPDAEGSVPAPIEPDPPADPPSDPESAAESIGTEGEAEEAGISIFALGEDLNMTEEARTSLQCFQHKASGVVHAARENHPPNEGEMTVFKCGRFANRNYIKLDEVPAVLITKCSSCWGHRG